MGYDNTTTKFYPNLAPNVGPTEHWGATKVAAFQIDEVQDDSVVKVSTLGWFTLPEIYRDN